MGPDADDGGRRREQVGDGEAPEWLLTGAFRVWNATTIYAGSGAPTRSVRSAANGTTSATRRPGDSRISRLVSGNDNIGPWVVPSVWKMRRSIARSRRWAE